MGPMTDGARQIKRATLADLLAIPDEDRCHEIIDGELVRKEAASGRHGGAQVALSQKLNPYSRRSRIASLPEDQIFRPDVAGWRRERLPELPSEVPILV